MKAAQRSDAKALLQAAMEFHSFIYELSANPLIVETMHLNLQHLRRAMQEVLRRPDYTGKVWREHQAILAATIAGNSEQAAALMREHLDLAYRRVRPVLASQESKSFSAA
jgi:DNA-binding GntR family transcriptional regulator